MKTDVSFEAASDEAVFLRDIRHHDDHTPLSCGSLANDYLPLNVSDLRSAEYAPEPWTNPQVRFARSHIFSRILRGHPGFGENDRFVACRRRIASETRPVPDLFPGSGSARPRLF